jgi:hypothetical protein
MTGSIGTIVANRSGDKAVAVERRVVLLSRDPGLASVTGRLLSNGDRIAHFRSAAELSNWSAPTVAAVILDSQPQARRLSYKQVRDRYDGPLVMLLDQGERRPDLPPDAARHFLHRPFKAADLSRLLGMPQAELGPFEAAIIAAWSRYATAEQAVRARRGSSYRPKRGPSYRVSGPSYRISRRPSLRRRARAWAATIAALMGLLLVFGLSGQSSCPSGGCTSFGGAVAGAAEPGVPQTSVEAAGSGGGGSAPPAGSGAASSQPPTSGGGSLPILTGLGGLIQSINPISAGDTLPPTGPQAVAGVPAPPGTTPPPTTPPGTTPPPTTAPPTTGPPTTAPPTTEPPTTAPPTTEPPTTAPPTTEPPTTAPPTTEPPTTAPPTTEPPTTAPPTTAAATTADPTTT